MQTPKPQAATGQPSAGTAGLPHSAPTVAGAARPASAQISRVSGQGPLVRCRDGADSGDMTAAYQHFSPIEYILDVSTA